jgi:glycosyltransferase involved in cell wall biosynthesis
MISLLLKKKIIYSGGIDELSDEVDVNKYKKIVFKFLFFLNYLISDFCNIVSKNDLKNTTLLLNKCFCKTNKLIYFPHCIDTELFNEYENIYEKENIITTICWMGTIANVKRKGVDKSLVLFKKILSYNPLFKFYIIGTPGIGKLYLDDIIEENDLKHNVIFTGPICENKKIELLYKSKFYFQISKYEGFGVAVVEAMLCNNFIIHSGKGGLDDTIGNNGLVINDFNNINDYILKFVDINENLSSYKNILETNKYFVKNNFTLQTRSLNFNLLISHDK